MKKEIMKRSNRGFLVLLILVMMMSLDVFVLSKSSFVFDKAKLTEGDTLLNGFLLDNVLHSEDVGDIHYHVYIPDSYDGSKPYAVFFTLPGYGGLYFQGVGENIETEDFGFEAQIYNDEMIIVAPQLEDWGVHSAEQTITLTEYFLENYNIDFKQVYINGYSGGGETLSIILGRRPELYTAALLCSSQWSGTYEVLIEKKTPVYLVIGESDEYYGSKPFKEAYQTIYNQYREQGMSNEEIDRLLVLDVKDSQYFSDFDLQNQHVGVNLFAKDEIIMNWLFQKRNLSLDLKKER